MYILGQLLLFLPYILSQFTCNELNSINDTNTYDYLEEIFEIDCSLNNRELICG
jgi:hypothetical protein